MELKRRDPLAVLRGEVEDHIAFRRSFGQSARKAAALPVHPVTKENFIADFEERQLTTELRTKLAGINQDILSRGLNYPLVHRLWVMHGSGLEEIPLI